MPESLTQEDFLAPTPSLRQPLIFPCKHFKKCANLGVTLDGRNRAIVIAESLARVIAAIRPTSVRSNLAVIFHLKNTELGPRRPCVRCAAIRIVRLAFVGVVFVPRGTAEWLARVRLRSLNTSDWRLAILPI